MKKDSKVKNLLFTSLLLFLLFSSEALQAQFGQDSSRLRPGLSKDKNLRLLVLPGISFTPETNWYFGLGGIAYFRMSKDSTTRPSDVRFTLAYTLNKQVIAYLPFQLWTKENNYHIFGQIAFYRYPYFFRGIGNDNPSYTYENYTASFPRIRIAATKRLGKAFYTGPVYWFQDTKMLEVEAGGLLDVDSVPGAEGGIISSFGWVLQYDNRDRIYAPQKGIKAELRSMQADQSIGSDFFYRSLDLNFAIYLPLQENKKGVLALNTYSTMQDGQAPFNKLASLGGPHNLRGFRNGHFRDRKLFGGQVEYRSAYAGPFGFAAFVGTANVSNNFQDLSTQYMRTAAGLGLRVMLDPKSGLNLRFDYARRNGAGEFYFAIGEAF